MWNFIKSLISRFRGSALDTPVTSKPKRDETSFWYFRRDILDQLDRYIEIAKRIKKTDPEGYAIYRFVGAALPESRADVYLDGIGALTPTWRAGARPAFGAAAWMADDTDDDKYNIRFSYYQRLDRMPCTVEPSNGQVYAVTIFYSRFDDETLAPAFMFYVSIDESCNVQLLRSAKEHRQKIQHKGGGFSYVTHRQWGLPEILTDNRDSAWPEDLPTPESRAQFIFNFTASTAEASMSACRVFAHKNGVTACFGIDVTRVPYFFSDRDDVVVDGQKKKIFHIVRTHKRNLASGKKTYVKSHFKGVRKFPWNGYNITIAMPGKHIPDFLDSDFGSHEYDSGEDTPNNMIHHSAAMRRIGAYQRGLR